MQSDAKAIAAGLTKAQRAALLQFSGKDYELLWAENPAEVELIRDMMTLGLIGHIMAAGENAMDLCPLGLAVKAQLERADDDRPAR